MSQPAKQSASQPRKRQNRSQRTKETILCAALELFREQSYDGTTMRQVAERSGLAVGASYYHFRRKEDLVLAYYDELQAESEEQAKDIVRKEKTLEKRMTSAIDSKLEQLAKDRSLIRVLGRVAGDPTSGLSPFSAESKEVRERAIAMFGSLIEGSGFKVGKGLQAHLPFALWIYYLGIVFFWAHDRSKDQKLTEQFVRLSLPLFLRLLAATALPLMGGMTGTVVKLVEILESFCAEPA